MLTNTNDNNPVFLKSDVIFNKYLFSLQPRYFTIRIDHALRKQFQRQPMQFDFEIVRRQSLRHIVSARTDHFASYAEFEISKSIV